MRENKTSGKQAAASAAAAWRESQPTKRERRRFLLAAGPLVLCAAGFLATAALAVNHHFYATSFGSSGTAEAQFGSASPTGVAVSQTSGDVYVADTGGSR